MSDAKDDDAAQAAEKLEEFAEKMRAFMTPAAIAEAFVAVAIKVSIFAMSRENVARWLRACADWIERGDEGPRPTLH